MKRRNHLKHIAAALFCAALLTGCERITDAFKPAVNTDDSEISISFPTDYADTSQDNTLAGIFGSAEAAPYDNPPVITDEPEAKEAPISEVNSYKGVPEEDIKSLMEEASGRYYYEKLNTEDKALYAEILYILKGRYEDVAVSGLEKERIDTAFSYVINDYPEIFYVEGYTYVMYLLGDKPSRIVFSGSYTMERSLIDRYEEYVKSYTDTFLNALYTSGLDLSDDYNTVRFTYEYIIKNTDYDKNAPYNQNIISVMVNGKSVCSGYTKTMQYLLNKCGISSTYVTGTVYGGQAHSWNLVKSNGDYYYVDTTWGDASYTYEGEQDISEEKPPVNYNYLLITTDEISKNHIFDEPTLMPLCSATKDNYYIREGTYFTGNDLEKLRSVFNLAYERGEEYVTLKMADAWVYNDMRDHLIKEQHIFDYVNTGGSITYSENDEGLYMIFYI